MVIWSTQWLSTVSCGAPLHQSHDIVKLSWVLGVRCVKSWGHLNPKVIRKHVCTYLGAGVCRLKKAEC